MLSVLAAVVLLQTPGVQRDSYGVAKITAPSWTEAFRAWGRVTAEDRLWQLEVSRHLAEGRMEKLTGASGKASDQEMLAFRYSDAEMQAQLDAQPDRIQQAYQAYADGINETIKAREAAGTLPVEYAKAGFKPEPWTVLDSCHITVNLIRRFGTGGGGELRNFLLMEYLKLQKAKDSRVQVMNDLGWHNDPDSPTTVSIQDDPLRDRHPDFPAPTVAETEAHLNLLPKTNLLELARGIRMASMEQSVLEAERHGVAHKLGSYAMVVGPKRSASGYPILLSAPQMGHTDPSPVSEIALDAPGLKVAGIYVPGIPAVVIGYTPQMAWGLTSGVADIEDIYFSPLNADGTYGYGNQNRPIEKVQIGDYTQERTHIGPVVLKSAASKAVYSKASALWKRELSCIDGVYDIYSAQKPSDIDALGNKLAATFNFFFTFRSGDFGWRYMGFVPNRAMGYDPRLPLPLTPDTEWKGFFDAQQMPHVTNPSSGLIVNWNNKPVAWWPNWDTPVWGSIFRNEAVLKAIPSGPLNAGHLERAAWQIARVDSTTMGHFAPEFQRAATDPETKALINAFDGWETQGSLPAAFHAQAYRELRKAIFEPWIGNLMGESTFAQAVQPPLVLEALQRKTSFDFLGQKSADDYLREAMAKALVTVKANSSGFNAGPIRYTNESPIPYINRGTYIQVIEMGPIYRGRSVAGPGVAESGSHAHDQADLVRNWTFKPMWPW